MILIFRARFIPAQKYHPLSMSDFPGGGEDDHLRVVQMCGPTGVFFQEFSLAAGII